MKHTIVGIAGWSVLLVSSHVLFSGSDLSVQRETVDPQTFVAVLTNQSIPEQRVSTVFDQEASEQLAQDQKLRRKLSLLHAFQNGKFEFSYVENDKQDPNETGEFIEAISFPDCYKKDAVHELTFRTCARKLNKLYAQMLLMRGPKHENKMALHQMQTFYAYMTDEDLPEKRDEFLTSISDKSSACAKFWDKEAERLDTTPDDIYDIKCGAVKRNRHRLKWAFTAKDSEALKEALRLPRTIEDLVEKEYQEKFSEKELD